MPSERTKTFTLILCCLAQFMVVLDVSIVNVALPSIRSDLGFTSGELQWIVNAYTLTFAGFLLLGGRAADLLGRRRVFMAGMLLFALASLVGGLAEDRLTLVVARAIQGLGGAVVAPATLSILATTFTDRAERNKALGLWGAMGGVGGATGALLGGALTQTLNWRWVLFINLPIGLFATFAAWRVVAEGRAERPGRHFDVAGAVSVTAGLVVLTYGIVRTEVNGWASAATVTTLSAGLALLAVFVYIEARRAPRAPDAAADLPLAAAERGQPRGLRPGQLGVRHVVLRHAVPPERPGLLAAARGLRVPAHDRADRGVLALRRAAGLAPRPLGAAGRPACR